MIVSLYTSECLTCAYISGSPMQHMIASRVYRCEDECLSCAEMNASPVYRCTNECLSCTHMSTSPVHTCTDDCLTCTQTSVHRLYTGVQMSTVLATRPRHRPADRRGHHEEVRGADKFMKKFGLEERYESGQLTAWERIKPKIWALFDEPYSSIYAHGHTSYLFCTHMHAWTRLR